MMTASLAYRVLIATVLAWLGILSGCMSEGPPRPGPDFHTRGIELGSTKITSVTGASADAVSVMLQDRLETYFISLYESGSVDSKVRVEELPALQQELLSYTRNPELAGLISAVQGDLVSLQLTLFDDAQYLSGKAGDSLIKLQGQFSGRDWEGGSGLQGLDALANWESDPRAFDITWQAQGYLDGQSWTATLVQKARRNIQTGLNGNSLYENSLNLHARRWNFGEAALITDPGLPAEASDSIIEVLDRRMELPAITSTLPADLLQALGNTAELPVIDGLQAILALNPLDSDLEGTQAFYSSAHPVPFTGGGPVLLQFSTSADGMLLLRNSQDLSIVQSDNSVLTITELSATLSAADMQAALAAPLAPEAQPDNAAAASLPLSWTINGSYLGQPFEIAVEQTSWISL